MSDVVDRITAVLHVHRFDDGTCTGCDWQYARARVEFAAHVAERVAAELPAIPRGHEIPDRQFVDDQGRRWEWCGGEPNTWAWRVTALAELPVDRIKLIAELDQEET